MYEWQGQVVTISSDLERIQRIRAWNGYVSSNSLRLNAVMARAVTVSSDQGRIQRIRAWNGYVSSNSLRLIMKP